jgi:hypothetical protein
MTRRTTASDIGLQASRKLSTKPLAKTGSRKLVA